MKQGDFSKLAKDYANRTGYSYNILKMIYRYMDKSVKELKVVDVGAGTGKLTEQILKLGFNCVAIEPNEAMRNEGMKNCKGEQVEWVNGSGENRLGAHGLIFSLDRS